MATSSITKNFIISGNKQAEKFLEALEASEKDKFPRVNVSAKEITGKDELMKFMLKWESNHNGRK